MSIWSDFTVLLAWLWLSLGEPSISISSKAPENDSNQLVFSILHNYEAHSAIWQTEEALGAHFSKYLQPFILL